ncbi:UNVERIFIED_CONTAM: hypothetical protein Scaly_0898400 [Sesamum calycinum]|uniref:Uncharacterized protein n=1 Tax=Sesamum calycinum TaxID=2727403 RepID=A0AAW2QWQ3_9LAMI
MPKGQGRLGFCLKDCFSCLYFSYSCVSSSLQLVSMIRYFGVYSAVSPIRPNLLPRNGEELGNLDQWINPPSTLMHNMSDKELFGKASSFPRLEKYPFKRVPKIAFMFLTKGPLPLAPLWERFFQGE